MLHFYKLLFLMCAAHCSTIPIVQAEPYQLTAGSSVLGFRENDKENVTLGFNSAFNALLSSDGVKCDFKIYESSEDLAQAISRQDINAFFGSPIEFFKSEAYFLKKPLASAVFSQKIKSRIFLLIRKDSGIQTLKELKGKKLSAHNLINNDVVGLYMETLLLEHQLPSLHHFFSEVQYTETSNRAFVDLFFKKVDATLMTETQYDVAVELNPQLRTQTKILESSDPYLVFLAALSKNTPETTANTIKNHLLNIHKTAKGRHVLNLMKMQGFVDVSVTELDNLRALIEKNKRLKAAQNAS